MEGGRVKGRKCLWTGLGNWKLIDTAWVSHTTPAHTEHHHTNGPFLVSIRFGTWCKPQARLPKGPNTCILSGTVLGTYATACSMSGANKRRATTKRQSSVSPLASEFLELLPSQVWILSWLDKQMQTAVPNLVITSPLTHLPT